MHARSRWIALVVAASLFVAGFAVASCGGGGEASTTTETTTQTETTTSETTLIREVQQTIVRLRVVDGSPVGGIERVTVRQGDLVSVYVASDVADEVHVHGYDLSYDVDAGGTARIEFTANVPGRFEVELEERGVQIADLTVEP